MITEEKIQIHTLKCSFSCLCVTLEPSEIQGMSTLFLRDKMGTEAQLANKSAEDSLGGDREGRQEFRVDINAVREKAR